MLFFYKNKTEIQRNDRIQGLRISELKYTLKFTQIPLYPVYDLTYFNSLIEICGLNSHKPQFHQFKDTI